MGDPKEGVLLGFHIEWVHMGGSVWRVRMGGPYGGLLGKGGPILWWCYGAFPIGQPHRGSYGGVPFWGVLWGFSYRAAP